MPKPDTRPRDRWVKVAPELKSRHLGHAVIDTWYVYPTPSSPTPHPGRLPFHELDNCVLTPHMSGWTAGTGRPKARALNARTTLPSIPKKTPSSSEITALRNEPIFS